MIEDRRAATGADFEVNVGGTAVQVTLGPDARSIGDVIAAINTAGGADLKAEIVPGANGIRLTDKTGGGRTITVTALNSSAAAADLGIATASVAALGLIAVCGLVFAPETRGAAMPADPGAVGDLAGDRPR